jgi:hypothetical protein
LYTGTWKNGKKHGRNCVESWNRGTHVYNGDFEDGARSGKGKYQHDGNVYEGDFERGVYHGHGKYYYADTGRVYEGQFANNVSSGKGVMVWPDGSRYEGTFRDGNMDGSGTQ